ncbi:MAG: DUF3987 domain-containing protein [Roseomonas sp.]|nr:DUF3987 domain-containing protein [Roseomonas sp.]
MKGSDMSFRDYMASRRKSEPPKGKSALDIPLAVTFFRDFSASSKQEAEISLRDLIPRLTDTTAPEKAALPWLKLARFGDDRTAAGSLRHNANMITVSGIEADYDGQSITVERARQILTGANLAAIIYTSPSHTQAAPRWRILCPLSHPIAPGDRAGMVARLNGLFVGALAGESFTASQAYYYGRLEGSEAHQVVAIEGRAIDGALELDAAAVGKPKAAPAPLPSRPRPATGEGSALGRAALAERCDAIRQAGEGAKHATINASAYAIGGLVASGDIPEGEAWGELEAALGAILHRCKDQRHAQKTLAKAFREGMGKPQSPAPMPVTPPDEIHPAAPYLAKLTRGTVKPLPVGADLFDVPGALGEFVAWCNATSISPQPFLALAAGITMIGAAAGRRYQTTTRLRTNIYAVGVADSGAGKDHARKLIRRAMHEAGLAQYLGGSDIASGAAIRTALTRHPAQLFQIDEFGDWLREVLGEKASTHKKQIAAILKELYSSAAEFWAGAEYSDQTARSGRPRMDIIEPHAVLYGTTTPGQLWAALQGASMHDGLMARVLLFVSPVSYPDEQEPAMLDPPPGLLAALKAMAAPHAGAGNLAGTMAASAGADPLTVPETSAAEAIRKAMRAEQLQRQRENAGTYITAIAARLAENAMKLALIRAISRDPADPVIDGPDVAWGRAVASHCMETLLREAGRHIADSDFQAKMNRAMELIRQHGPITERELIRRGFRYPSRDREEVLKTLVEGGFAIAEQPARPPGQAGRPPAIQYSVGTSS